MAARINGRAGGYVMTDKIYDVPADWKSRAYIDDAKYKEMYARSIKDPIGFWGDEAKRLDWIKKPTKVKNTYFTGDVSMRSRTMRCPALVSSTRCAPSATVRHCLRSSDALTRTATSNGASAVASFLNADAHSARK